MPTPADRWYMPCALIWLHRLAKFSALRRMNDLHGHHQRIMVLRALAIEHHLARMVRNAVGEGDFCSLISLQSISGS